LLFAESPPYVMGQMGHTTAALTLALYAREMNRRDGEPALLRALAGGSQATAKLARSTSSTLDAGAHRQAAIARIVCGLPRDSLTWAP
jgi:hypothetical protein